MINRKFDIYFNEPYQGGNELTYIREVLNGNWLTTEGEQLIHFKSQLADYFNNDKISLTNSGTSALHLALAVLDIQKNDFVICQSFSFVATANPILYQGAIPIFVDSERDTWNMAPQYLSDAIAYCLKMNKKPKAVILAHTYGTPGDLNAITEICKQYDIPLIEDAAEAFGSKYLEQKLGNFGDLSVISFNGNKIITTTSGGALIAKKVEYIDLANNMANQAKDPEIPYDHIGVGFNYKMSNLCAAIGRAQMENIEERIARKRLIFNRYYELLSKKDGIEFQSEPKSGYSNRWVTTLLLNKKSLAGKIVKKMHENRIECRYLWKPIHLLPQFIDFPYFGEGIGLDFHKRGIALPGSIGMTNDQIEKICEIINEEL